MSALPVWVRARDGALYKDPMIVFPEGFVRFNEEGSALLTVWLEKVPKPGEPLDEKELHHSILPRAFGSTCPDVAYGVREYIFLAVGKTKIPQTDPEQEAPSATYRLNLSKRIPRPEVHGGTARYPSRVGPGTVRDFPPSGLDAYYMHGAPPT